MPVFRLSQKLSFPPPRLAEPGGLLAVGGDLSPERLLLAYKKGIFPWYSDDDPLLWWSPDPRLVLYPGGLKISRSLARTMRKGRFRTTFDADFSGVIEACARRRGENRKETWITPAMMKAYIKLNELGYAHSVETWREGMLVGGLYGVSIGRAFFGESMFSLMSDASKVALVQLMNFIEKQKFDFIDCQIPTDHLVRMGGQKVRRESFLNQLADSIKYPSLTGPWES